MSAGVLCRRHNMGCLVRSSRRRWRRIGIRVNSGATSTSADSDEDFLLNGGTVEGVWVFCRHGDRTPCRSLAAEHMEPKEAAFWQSRLPYPDAVTAFKMLSETFPPQIHPSNNDGKFFDVERKPFGFLTEHGMEQMRTNGRRFYNRYEHYGFHLDDDHDVNDVSSDDNGFLQSWDVRAYSTNYLRTVLSVQCFLDGLLGTNAYDPAKAKGGRLSSMAESGESIDHTIGPTHSSKEPKVPVKVRERSKDTLNAFDRNPDLMKNLVADVITSPKFQEHDAKAAPLAARLANFLPGLGLKSRNTFGGPSGINWIDASDHFICRTAHDVAFSRFSEHEHDAGVEQTLSAMAHQTLAHLAWRFRQVRTLHVVVLQGVMHFSHYRSPSHLLSGIKVHLFLPPLRHLRCEKSPQRFNPRLL
jgi:hypothetical protein